MTDTIKQGSIKKGQYDFYKRMVRALRLDIQQLEWFVEACIEKEDGLLEESLGIGAGNETAVPCSYDIKLKVTSLCLQTFQEKAKHIEAQLEKSKKWAEEEEDE